MSFRDPWALLFIPAVFILARFLRRKGPASGLRFSHGGLLKDSVSTPRLLLAKNIFYLRAAAIIFFLTAMARPRVPLDEAKVTKEGIEIVLTIDSSGSMLAEDFTLSGRRQNRLAVVKTAVEDFIRKRDSDRIGMVAFAARAYTVCPLTLDYDWLIKNLERVRIGAIEDGTAIGSAISSSLNRLKDTAAKSKVIILLTDGINNAGKIDPLTAAEAAKALGVKIYTIGAGSKGPVPFPFRDMWGQTVYQNVKIDMDENLLRGIADKTGGQFFRATDTESLKDIYDRIDSMEKTAVEEKGYQEYNELFTGFLMAGLALLAMEMILSGTILRKIP